MAFISTPSHHQASESTATMFADATAAYGYLPNMYELFGHRPEVMEAWGVLLGHIKENMPSRRYELVTLAAAKELKSSYCMLAHGSVLLEDEMTPMELVATVETPERAPIEHVEKAIMSFALKVVRDATSVTREDVDGLRHHGLTDEEIFDITTAAAARCFFSKTLDALGALPDHVYQERLGPVVRKALTIGRPIEPAKDAAPAAVMSR
ncbi:carboxymuconolactone decarboxylase family protein [Rhizobium sp. RAF56]|uniref:carboxymuconolactone decarboxylase family protein n=1 Tax=Rhizobium sp. RAF56 TaxID=3233062 RepID=UPI003F98A55E